MELVGLFSQQIPEPIAPARPVQSPVGTTIPITTSSGISGVVDSLGNLWSNAGQYLGKIGTSTAQSPTVAQPSSPPAAESTDYLTTLEKWAAGIVDRSTTPTTGLSIEDLVLIVVGLMLIGAAVFTFRDTQQVIKTVTKSARGAADTKLAAAIAA